MKAKSKENTEKLKSQVIFYHSSGHSVRQFAPIVGMSTGWVGNIVKELKKSVREEIDRLDSSKPMTEVQLSKVAGEVLRRQNLTKPSPTPSVTDTLNTRTGRVSVKETIQNRLA